MTPESNRSALYLKDLGILIEQAAQAAREERKASTDVADSAYAEGKAMAFYEVVSLMLQQAEVFGIHPSALGLEGVVPERDII